MFSAPQQANSVENATETVKVIYSKLTEDPIHCPLIVVCALPQGAAHFYLLVLQCLKNHRLADNTFVLA